MKNIASAKRAGSLLLLLLVASAAYAAEPIKFSVSIDSAAAHEPISGRLLIFMKKDDGKSSNIFEPDYTDPNAVFISGTEITDLSAGKAIDINADTLAFPSAFSNAPAGDYQVY